MSAALDWLERNTADAPPQLRARMREAVHAVAAPTVHDALVAAGTLCLERSIAQPDSPDCALDLLSADALLTHACAAAAEAGNGALEQLTARLRAPYFQQLLDKSA